MLRRTRNFRTCYRLTLGLIFHRFLTNWRFVHCFSCKSISQACDKPRQHCAQTGNKKLGEFSSCLKVFCPHGNTAWPFDILSEIYNSQRLNINLGNHARFRSYPRRRVCSQAEPVLSDLRRMLPNVAWAAVQSVFYPIICCYGAYPLANTRWSYFLKP